MTDRCDGRLRVGREILRPPSDGTHNPNLGGPGARYVGYTSGEPIIANGRIVVPSIYSFATGQVPEGVPSTPDQRMGGLAANYDRAELQQSENQAIGRARVTEPGKGMLFAAMTYVGNQGTITSTPALSSNAKTQESDWLKIAMNHKRNSKLIAWCPSSLLIGCGAQEHGEIAPPRTPETQAPENASAPKGGQPNAARGARSKPFAHTPATPRKRPRAKFPRAIDLVLIPIDSLPAPLKIDRRWANMTR